MHPHRLARGGHGQTRATQEPPATDRRNNCIQPFHLLKHFGRACGLPRHHAGVVVGVHEFCPRLSTHLRARGLSGRLVVVAPVQFGSRLRHGFDFALGGALGHHHVARDASPLGGQGKGPPVVA